MQLQLILAVIYTPWLDEESIERALFFHLAYQLFAAACKTRSSIDQVLSYLHDMSLIPHHMLWGVEQARFPQSLQSLLEKLFMIVWPCAGLCSSWILMALGPGIALCRYQGSERCMLIPNTLFRVGGAAILLTNKFGDRHRVKYELEHVVRVHLGSDDMAYRYLPVDTLACYPCARGMRCSATTHYMWDASVPGSITTS